MCPANGPPKRPIADADDIGNAWLGDSMAVNYHNLKLNFHPILCLLLARLGFRDFAPAFRAHTLGSVLVRVVRLAMPKLNGECLTQNV